MGLVRIPFASVLDRWLHVHDFQRLRQAFNSRAMLRMALPHCTIATA